MRIAVDVMGGDHGCGVVIEGAKRALHANKEITALYLVGNQAGPMWRRSSLMARSWPRVLVSLWKGSPRQ